MKKEQTFKTKKILLKTNINFASILLMSSLFVKILDYLGIIYLSYYISIFINILIVLVSSIFFKIGLNFLFDKITQQMENMKKLPYFLNVAFDLLSIIFLLLGLVISFYGLSFLLREFKIVISFTLIFSIVWNIFFFKSDIAKSSENYLKKLGMGGSNNNFNTIFADIKVLASIIVAKIGLEIFATIPYISSIQSMSVYLKYVFKLIDFSMLLYAIVIFRRLTLIFLDKLSAQIKESENEIVKNYLFFIPLVKNLGTIFIFILFFLSILNLFDYTAVSFLASLPALIQSIGILGVGLSFIAKDTIANFMSGIFIITDAPFVIGDRIRINEVYGDVEEIGIRTTKIKTLENCIVTVPNSQFTEKAVTSYRKYGSRFKIRYPLFIDDKADIDEAKELLYEILSESDEILKVPNPRIYFVDYGQNSIKLLMTFWVRDISKSFITKDYVNSKIKKTFKEKGIKVYGPKLIRHIK